MSFPPALNNNNNHHHHFTIHHQRSAQCSAQPHLTPITLLHHHTQPPPLPPISSNNAGGFFAEMLWGDGDDNYEPHCNYHPHHQQDDRMDEDVDMLGSPLGSPSGYCDPLDTATTMSVKITPLKIATTMMTSLQIASWKHLHHHSEHVEKKEKPCLLVMGRTVPLRCSTSSTERRVTPETGEWRRESERENRDGSRALDSGVVKSWC